MPRPFLPPPLPFLLMLAIISVSAVEKQLQCGDWLNNFSLAFRRCRLWRNSCSVETTYFLAVRRRGLLTNRCSVETG